MQEHPLTLIDKIEPNPLVIVALASLVILVLGIQIEAVYSDYFFRKSHVKGSGITLCFYSVYSMRWLAQLFGVLGMGISVVILYKRKWKILDSFFSNLVLFGPALIMILDDLIIRIYLN